RGKLVTGVQTCALPILNFLEGDVLAFHLAVDAVDMLGARADLGLDARRRQFLGERRLNPLHVLLAVGAALCDPAGDLLIFFRAEIGRASCRESLWLGKY